MPTPEAIPVALDAVSRRFHHVGGIAVVNFGSLIIIRPGFRIRGGDGGRSLTDSSSRSLSDAVLQASTCPQVGV